MMATGRIRPVSTTNRCEFTKHSGLTPCSYPGKWTDGDRFACGHHKHRMLKDECAICLEECRTGRFTQTKCNHVFHTNCIERWCSDHDTCPVCRTRFQLRESHIIETDPLVREHLAIELGRLITAFNNNASPPDKFERVCDIYDFLCEHHVDMRMLGERLARTVRDRLDDIRSDTKQEIRESIKGFGRRITTYRKRLRAYFEWAYECPYHVE